MQHAEGNQDSNICFFAKPVDQFVQLALGFLILQLICKAGLDLLDLKRPSFFLSSTLTT
jgi:hypothetical protein